MSTTRDSKTVQIYGRLKHALMFQKVPPRTRLDICGLADKLGVSNTPVREALIMLADEGIIHADPGHGYFSKPLDASEFIEEYEMALIILKRSIETCGNHFSNTKASAPNSIFEIARDDTDRKIHSYADCIESLYLHIAASRGSTNFLRAIHTFNDKTRFIRQLDLGQPGRLREIDGAMTELAECLQRSDARSAIANLERQYQGKVDLLHHLVNEGNLIALNANDTW